jgi:hypothetical protein
VLVVPAGADGATSPAVSVRAEGASATLVPQMLVQTKPEAKIHNEPCSGASATGALTLASHGLWSGKWFSSLNDFEVTNILGEVPTGNNFWTLWINGRSSQTGGCGTAVHAGDHVLWFDCLGTSSGTCSNNPLALSAPTRARAGRSVTVAVTQLDGNGHGTPMSGATINGGGVETVTGPNGQASFVPSAAGVLRLHAVKSGATPSDTQVLCVYARRASQCGSVGRNGPRVRIVGIRQHQVFVGQGPRLLHGTAGPDPVGITDVRLTLLRRNAAGRCAYFNAVTGRWHRRGCKAPTPGASFSVGASTSWSYLLPKPLGVGQYTLNVNARDANGRHTKPARGRSTIAFRVRP